MKKDILLIKLNDVSELLLSKKYRPSGKEHAEAKLPHSARKIIGILHMEGKLNQLTLAKRVNVSAQAISKSIKVLEDEKLIVKEYGNQKNENLIRLTEKGLFLAEDLKKHIKEHQEKIFKNFSDEDIDNLNLLLDKIIENHKE